MNRTAASAFGGIVLVLTNVGGLAGQVRDSAGVRVITGPDVSSLRSFPVQDGPDFRVGWSGGLELESVFAGAILEDGRVAFADEGPKLIRVLSSSGAVLATYGRSGEGPGEYQGIASLEAGAGDSLWVHDYVLGRLSLLDAERGFVDSEQIGRVGAVLHQPTAVSPDGVLTWTPYSFSRRRGGSEGWLEAPLLVSEGLEPERRQVTSIDFVELQLDNGRPSRDPFGNFGIAEGFDSGFVAHRNDRPELLWYSHDGVLQQVVRWGQTARRVDDEVWSEYVAAWAAMPREFPMDEARQNEMLREERRSASPRLPLTRYLHAASDGSVLLGEYTFLGNPGRRFLWVAPDGTIIGHVEFPRPIRLLAVRDGKVLGVEQDDFDVQAVVAYQLPSRPRGQ